MALTKNLDMNLVCYLRGLPVGLLLIALLLHSLHAETRVLPFQGRLTDSNGAPVADGAKVVQFQIYDAPTGGTVKWIGEVQKLTVNGGLVNTLLGSKASLSGVDFSTPTYLQITVDADGDGQITLADAPLLPRQSVVAAIYASEAGNSRKLNNADWSALLTGGSNDPATGSLRGDKIAPGSISSAQLGPNSILAANVAPGAVGTTQLADASVTANKLTGGIIGTNTLADNAVTTPKLVDGAVTNAKIASQTITTDRLVPDCAFLMDERPSGTDGGTANAGWMQRSLNKITAVGNSISLNNNIISLNQGTYFIDGDAPCYSVGATFAVLRRVGDPAPVIRGTSEYSYSYVFINSPIRGIVKVAEATENFEVWQYFYYSRGTDGLGVASRVAGNPEVYTTVKITRLQ